MQAKRFFLMVCVVLGVGVIPVFAQYSITGGTGIFNSFGAGRNFYGMELGLEYSDIEDESIWGRISFYPSVENRTSHPILAFSNDQLSTDTFYLRSKSNYLQLSGGSRYYIGDGYDVGIGAYGGYKFSLLLFSVRNELQGYEEVKENFPKPNEYYEKSQVIFLTVGLNGGVKYSIPRFGTLFLDGSVDYGILGQFTNPGYAYSDMFNANIFFSMSLGVRKTIF